jgi:hypothetical protein
VQFGSPAGLAPHTGSGPDGPDFDHVIRALVRVVPAQIEFRASPLFEGSDGWLYAFLPREVWAELEQEAPEVVAHYFPRGHRL